MHITHASTSFYVILSLVCTDAPGEVIAISTNRVTTRLMLVSRLLWPGSQAGSPLLYGAEVQFVTEAPVGRACPSGRSLNGFLDSFL